MQDFFQTRDSAVYTPAFTLHEMINNNEVKYKRGFFVTKFEESDEFVTVYARDIETNELKSFVGRKLFLGAGAINSGRIVLESYGDYDTKLSLLDNSVAFLPFCDLSLIGKAFPRYIYPGAELVAISDNDEKRLPVQASVYGLYGPLRTDLIAELPFSVKGNIVAIKNLCSALGMAQIFFPDEPSKENYIKLDAGNSLEISYKSKRGKFTKDLKPFISMLFRMKYLTSGFLCKFPMAGNSIHYAGCLPMKENPNGRYETNKVGLLNTTKRTYIIDGANLPVLPSKNHSFTIMANAMRIAEIAKSNMQ